MSIIRYTLFAGMAVICVFRVLCADSSPAYNFLNITSSPKIYGLGGVNISSTEAGLLAIDQNPALLGPEHSTRLELSYMHYIGNSNFASLAYSHSVSERSAWAASIHYFGYGSMDRTDANGVNIGSFSPTDVAFSGLYSHDFTDRIRGGFAIKGLYSGYDSYTAFALGVDLGVNYYDSDRDLSLSATVVNLGGQIKRFNESYDRLPVDVRLGWTQSFPGLPIRFSVTAWNLTKWKLPYYHTGDGSIDETPEMKSGFISNFFRHLVFGADIVPSDKFYISVGYNYKTRTDMSTYHRNFISGWSLGAGLNVGTWGVGLAFSQPHTGATTLMVSLSAGISDLIGTNK